MSIDLETEMIDLTLALYNNPVVPRNVVQLFVDTLINFTNTTFSNFIKQEMQKCSGHNDQILNNISTLLRRSNTVFDKFSSEYLRFKIYEQKGLLMPPQEYYIGTICSQNTAENNSSIKKEVFYGQYVSLTWSLRLLLEIPGVFDLIKNYMNDLESETNIISNFLQADLWKKVKKNFGEKICIPLFIYEDDFEAGNRKS